MSESLAPLAPQLRSIDIVGLTTIGDPNIHNKWIFPEPLWKSLRWYELVKGKEITEKGRLWLEAYDRNLPGLALDLTKPYHPAPGPIEVLYSEIGRVGHLTYARARSRKRGEIRQDAARRAAILLGVTVSELEMFVAQEEAKRKYQLEEACLALARSRE